MGRDSFAQTEMPRGVRRSRIREIRLHLVEVLRENDFPSQHVIVELATSDLTGWGEMSDLGHLPLYQFDLVLLQRTLQDLLVGRDIADRLQIDALMTHAFPDEGHMYSRSGLIRQGIDLAVLDALGRMMAVPASDLLGGGLRRSIDVCYPIFRLAAGEDPDVHLEAVARRAADGFNLFRLYVGGDLATECRFLAAFRDRFPDLHIKSFDFSNLLTAREAIRWAQALSEIVEPQLIEGPAPRGDLDGLRAFSRPQRWPVSEHVVSPAQAWNLVRHGRVDILNISPYVLGGITPALRIAHFAAVAGVGVLVGTTQELGVGTAAAAILGSVVPTLDYPCDNVGPCLYRDDVVVSSPSYVSGQLMVPDGVGLGVDVDRERLSRLTTKRLGVDLAPADIFDRRAGPPRPRRGRPTGSSTST